MDIPLWAYFFTATSFVLLFSKHFKPLGLAGLISIAIILITLSTTAQVKAAPQMIFIDDSEISLGLKAQETTSDQSPDAVIPAQTYISQDGKPSKNPADYPLNLSTPCEVNTSYSAQVLQWCGLITYYAKDRGLDPNLIAAVITQESGGQVEPCDDRGHFVIGDVNICGSKDGAIGMMQVMASDGISGQKYTVFVNRPSSLELLNPETNIAFGTRMLKYGGAATDPREALFHYGPATGDYSYADLVLSIYRSHQ